MSFLCHSDVVSLSFQCRLSARDITKFCRWNDPETKLSLVLVSFYFRTIRNEKIASFEGTTGTKSERPKLFGKRGANGGERGPNDPGPPVIPFFVPVVRAPFLVRESFWIVQEEKKISERHRNDVGTRRAGGQKWDGFPIWKPSFRHHSTIVLVHPELPKAQKAQMTSEWRKLSVCYHLKSINRSWVI